HPAECDTAVDRAGIARNGRRGPVRSVAVVSRSRHTTAGTELGYDDRGSKTVLHLLAARAFFPRRRDRVDSPCIQLYWRRPARISRSETAKPMRRQKVKIFPLGDSALTVEFGCIISVELNKKAI